MVERGGRGGGGVQSVDRAFGLLEAVAEAGGSARLSELAASTGLPLPTIHRLLRALVSNGYLRQEASRSYALGPRLIPLGERAARMLGSWAIPHLSELVAQIGETANLAMFEGDLVIYVAQVPSAHSMRMFTEVGRRVSAHSTGVGKALLSQLPDDEVIDLLGRTGMPARTERTLTTPETLLADLAKVRDRGWAMDDAEYEAGVCCLAMPVPDAPARVAISISGPSSRVTAERVGTILPVLGQVSRRLGADLQAGNPAHEPDAVVNR